MDLTKIDLNAQLGEISDLLLQYTLSAFGAIILLIAGFFIAGFVRRWVVRSIDGIGHVDNTISTFVGSVARYAILIIMFIAVLGQFGVQTASILAALGAAGLAIGLALQGTLQNIAAGLMLLFLRPFKVGEYIETGNVSGTVEEIGIFATRLKSVDGLYTLAPNSSLWNTPVTNYSRHDVRRNDIIVGIGYEDDIDKAEKLLMTAAKSEDRVLNDPVPRVFVSELGDNAVNITLRYWTTTPDYFFTGKDLTREIKQTFDKMEISFPYPQRDVHIYQQDG